MNYKLTRKHLISIIFVYSAKTNAAKNGSYSSPVMSNPNTFSSLVEEWNSNAKCLTLESLKKVTSWNLE